MSVYSLDSLLKFFLENRKDDIIRQCHLKNIDPRCLWAAFLEELRYLLNHLPVTILNVYYQKYHKSAGSKTLRKQEKIDRILGGVNSTGYINESYRLTIEGCVHITEMRVRTVTNEQMVLLIGEKHTLSGNAEQILKDLLHYNDCPVDVLVEKDFQSHMKPSVFGWANNDSNVAYFFNDPLQECTRRGKVPVDKNILDQKYKSFYKKCIKPYRGRIKIWATDMRLRSWFTYIYLLKLTPSQRRTYLNPLWQMVFDIDEYRKDPKNYDNRVRELVKNLYDNIISWVFTIPPVNLNKLFNDEKGHMSLMKNLNHLPYPIVKALCKDTVQKLTNPKILPEYILEIMDIDTTTRILRLLSENKNRIIVVFAGYLHTDHIKDLLQNIYLDEKKTQYLYHVQTLDCSIKTKTRTVDLKPIPLTIPTERIRLYQEFIKNNI